MKIGINKQGGLSKDIDRSDYGIFSKSTQRVIYIQKNKKKKYQYNNFPKSGKYSKAIFSSYLTSYGQRK